ncbi:hypothetical protein ACSBR2_010520 [Camellia fascicularis]
MAIDPIHVVLFPFMSKGHTIPILSLSRLLLLRHDSSVTIFTTTANRPLIAASLSDTAASIIALPFPDNIPGLPSGVESTDQLPSISLFSTFAAATNLIKPHFEKALQSLPKVTFIVSDGFLPWTLQSASKFGIPRLVFYGMSNHAMSLCHDVIANRLLLETESDDEPFSVTNFPWIKLTKNDFEPVMSDRNQQKTPESDFLTEQFLATSRSYGLIVNSFYNLEPLYLDHWNRNCAPKAWCVGPLCLAEPPRVELEPHRKPPWVRWLDQKRAQGCSVLYIAFGSQAEISPEQFSEIKIGLEKSKVNFLWVVRRNQSELGVGDGFEERVKERGMVVREWVNQREILEHESVQGFLSHCGWNSVLESICAKVPILGWPMMAEQHLNARMVVEEMKVGLRVETWNGSVRGFVKWEGLKKMVEELMVGEMGKEVRRKVKEVGGAAVKAVEEGGSSWRTLNQLIDEVKTSSLPCRA